MNKIEQSIYEAVADNRNHTSQATDDIMDIIESNLSVIETDNLYDLQKFEIVEELMKKCSLQTLEEISDIYADGKCDYNKVLLPSYKDDKDYSKYKVRDEFQ